MSTIISPLNKSTDISLIRSFPSVDIIEIYKRDQNMDVSAIFKGIDRVDLYRCNATGFEFFIPLSLAGNDAYYQELGKKSWYYHPNRWEHIETIKTIREEKILEVGCGSGAFLKQVKSKTKASIQALELNSETVTQLTSEGFDVYNIFVEDFAIQHPNSFDLVCSFQVLEHVCDPYSFIEAQINLLKTGGRLIIGVPNNDSFIGRNLHASRILNEPPHHMGRWTLSSLKSLEKIFPNIKMTTHTYEPMVNDNVSVFTWNLVHRMVFKSQFLTKAVWKLKLYYPVQWIVRLFKNKIKGQTILVEFIKL